MLEGLERREYRRAMKLVRQLDDRLNTSDDYERKGKDTLIMAALSMILKRLYAE